MMQSGAFLQLVLVLAAIASRLSILLTEVRAVAELSWSAGLRVLQTLYVSLRHGTVKGPPRSLIRLQAHGSRLSKTACQNRTPRTDSGSTPGRVLGVALQVTS